MRRFLLSTVGLAIALAAWAAPTAQTRSGRPQPLTINLVALTPVVSSGETIRMQANLRNHSSKNLLLQGAWENGHDNAFVWQVKTVGGVALRRIPEPRGALEFGPGSILLRPGDSSTREITLYGFDLSRPGRYYTRLSRYLPPNLGGRLAHSNWVRITVRKAVPRSMQQVGRGRPEA